jgi:hypothetical protein
MPATQSPGSPTVGPVRRPWVDRVQRRPYGHRMNAAQRHTGTAGEYFVAAELSLRGWLATVTIKNAPGIDVLAKHPKSGQTASIQVKTTSKPSGRFILSAKDEELARGEDEWYVFVALKPLGERADFYVVPRNVVAGFVYCAYREWHSQPDRYGNLRRHVTTRDMQAAQLGRYQEEWSLLEAPASDAPFRGPDWWPELADRWPRSAGYPGLMPFDRPDAERVLTIPRT